MQVEILRQPEQTVAKLSGELDHHAAGEVRERIDSIVLQQWQPPPGAGSERADLYG